MTHEIFRQLLNLIKDVENISAVDHASESRWLPNQEGATYGSR